LPYQHHLFGAPVRVKSRILRSAEAGLSMAWCRQERAYSGVYQRLPRGLKTVDQTAVV
jgi:hypothetical protein